MSAPSFSSPKQQQSSYIHKVVDNTVLHNRITPTWCKVSNTCYAAHTKKVHGYGRLVRNITVSHDCPEEFIRIDHLTRPKDFVPAPKEFASRKAGVEAGYVLPGGSSFREQPTRGRQYDKIKIDKQYIIEPKLTNRSGTRMDLAWDSGRRSARGHPTSSSPSPPFASSSSSNSSNSFNSSSQLALSPVKIKNNATGIGIGGVRPGTGGGHMHSSSRNVLATRSDVHCARVRTAAPSSRSCRGFANVPPKTFANKTSWWIHED